MRTLRLIGSAAAVLILAPSALAADWSPQGTVVHGHGNVTLTSGTGTATCTVTEYRKASGALAITTNSAGVAAGPTFSNCTNNLGLSPTSVTSSSPWRLTATSTTSMDLTGSMVIVIGGGTCVITAIDFSVPNNAWNNVTHTVSYSSATAFDQVRHGFCPLTATLGVLAGSEQFPFTVT